MNFKVRMGKYLVQNLCYPAVLGSFLFTLIQTIANGLKGTNTGFLANSIDQLLIKLFLALTLIAFFCCDYLYSYVTRVYKPKYFFIDFLAIILLVMSFFGINIDTEKPASISNVIYPFIVFQFFFFLWDRAIVVSIRSPQKDSIELRRKLFFKKLMKQQIIAAIGLLLIVILNKFEIISYNTLFILFILNLIYTTYFYYSNVYNKYDVTDESQEEPFTANS